MRSSGPPLWALIAVPVAIATVAFALGQAVTGSGMIAAIVGSTVWTIYAVQQGRKTGSRNG